jgi:putative copper export protein
VSHGLSPRAGVIGRLPWTFSYAALMASVVTLVIVLVAGGGAPVAAPTGLPDAGLISGWGVPVLRLFADLAGVVAAAGLLTTAFLLGGIVHETDGSAAATRRLARWGAGSIAVAALAQIPLTFSQFAGRPLTGVTLPEIGSFGVHAESGRILLLQAVLAACVALAVSGSTTRSGSVVLLCALLVSVAAVPAGTGHSYGAVDHRALAVASIAVHVAAATVWVGGLVGLTLVVSRARPSLQRAVARFSALALGCVTALLLTGVMNAWLRLGSWQMLWADAYGRLVAAKALALTVLSLVGFIHRRRTIPALCRDDRRPLLRLAAAEIVLMTITMGLAVGLSRTPPPTASESPVVSLVGAAAA